MGTAQSTWWTTGGTLYSLADRWLHLADRESRWVGQPTALAAGPPNPTRTRYRPPMIDIGSRTSTVALIPFGWGRRCLARRTFGASLLPASAPPSGSRPLFTWTET